MGSPTNDFFGDLLARRVGSWAEFVVAAKTIAQDHEQGIIRGRQYGASDEAIEMATQSAAVARTAMYGAKIAEMENRGGDFETPNQLGYRLNDALLLGMVPYQFAQSARDLAGIKRLADKAGLVIYSFKKQALVLGTFGQHNLAPPQAETVNALILEATGRPVPRNVVATVQLTLDQLKS